MHKVNILAFSSKAFSLGARCKARKVAAREQVDLARSYLGLTVYHSLAVHFAFNLADLEKMNG